jgi:thermitase
MRRKLVCIFLVTLIFVSSLDIMLFARPSLVQAREEPFSKQSPNGETKEVAPLNRERSQCDSLKDPKEAVNAKESGALSSSSHSSSITNKLSFNDTSKWKNFAYVKDDKTRLIVGINNSKPANIVELEKIAEKHGAKIVNTFSIRGTLRAVVVELQLSSVATFSEDIREVGLASYVEPNMKVQAYLVPNDPYWNLQWGPQKIEAEWAWNTTVGNYDVIVAVVDTGIYYPHPDIAPNYVALGYDWVNNDADPIDDHGHGTHCAGIVAAVLNNNIGTAGLAQVRVMAEKALNSEGSGYWDWVANGIVHAVDHGARIISMSLGGYGESELVHEAVRYAHEAGVLVVAAAGNDNTNMKSYPAAYEGVIAVAATDQYDGKAYFSNWGDWIELAAPGVDIISTTPWGYESWSGTSMACPHVAGLAALIWSWYPSRSRDWLRLWLRYTADDLGEPCFDVYFGYGRINARKAFLQPPPGHEMIAYEWETLPYVEPGSSGIVNATILNFGESNETNVAVQLLANGTIVDSTLIGVVATGESAGVSLAWNPVVEGIYNLTLYVMPVPGEANPENNILQKFIYVGFPVVAVVLHSAGNIDNDIITNWQVLNGEWRSFGEVMVYVDYTSLNKPDITYQDIAATKADVLIVSCAYDPYAGWEFTDSEIEAIKRYVYEGHGLIATAGTLYSRVPNNNKLASMFGLNEANTWDATSTDLLHLLNTSHPVFANVPNPLVFPDVVTSLPYDRRWDSNELTNGRYLALGHYQESAIVTFKGLVYISPWLEKIPPYYQHHLQLLYNAIVWSRYQRPQHELVVSLEAPKRLNPSDSIWLNATVSNFGRPNEIDVQLQLLINGALVDSVTIPELLVDSSYTFSHLWTPTAQGVYNITAYAPPILGEEITQNNVAKEQALALLISLRNVLVYSDDAAVTSSQRYVIVALDDLGINYTYVADDPWGFGTALVSQPWDLVIVDHCNYFAMGNYWNELESYVRNGGSLILSTFDVDGSNSEYTTLWETLGVHWVSDMWTPEPVYRWAPSHPVFTFPNTVGDLTSYSEGYGDNGDHVTATTGTAIAGFAASPAQDRAALVEGNTYPTMLFSFLLDEFRYDQDGDGKLDAVELWENTIVYLAKGYEHDLAVSLDAPSSLQMGDTTTLNATVRNRGNNNETDVRLFLLINSSLVGSATISELATGESYTLSHEWTPTTGNYNITVYALPVPEEEQTANNVVAKTTRVYFYMRLYLPNEWVGGGSPMGWHADDSSWQYTLPFDFPFYGIGYRTIYISSNGLITFTGPDSSYSNDVSRLAGKLALAIAWDDWVSDGSYDIYIWDNSTHVGIRWEVRHYGSSIVANFEAILRVDGVVQCNYGYSDGEISATIGISNGQGHIIAEDVTTINSIHTIVFTPFQLEHELIVELVTPQLVRPGDSSILNATVYNIGRNNETNVALHMLINDAVVSSITIPELTSGTSYTMNHMWTPTLEGTYNVTAYAPAVPDEATTTNNVATRAVNVRTVKYLLFDQTHGTDSITNYDVWTASLIERGYVVETCTNGPISSGLLERYDVFIIPQATSGYTSDELLAIRDFVSCGCGLLTIGDDIPWIYDQLTSFAGITWQSGGYGGITTDIIPHPVTSGVASVYLSDPIAVMYVVETAQSLIRDPAQSIMLAASEHYSGKVIGFADEGSLWSYGISQADNLRLADNMIDWLAIPIELEHDLAASLDAPETLGRGESTFLNATVYNRGLSSEIDVRLQLLIGGAVVESVIVPELPSHASYTVVHLWNSSIWGINYSICAYAWPVVGESLTVNNMQAKTVYISLYTRTYQPPQWIDGGNPMGWHADDSSWQYNLPFSFPFYEVYYTTIYVSSNGLIAFNGPDSSLGNSKQELAYKLAVASAWDDWVSDYPYDIYICEDSTHVGIGWYVRHFGSSTVASFEVTLYANGTMQFNYAYNDGPISATIGISNGAGEIIAQDLTDLNCINTIVFSPLPYTHDLAIHDVTAYPANVYVGQTVGINVTAKNEGETAENFTVKVYYNETSSLLEGLIGERDVYLNPGESVPLYFEWNTTGLQTGNYNITAVIPPVLGETDTSDNTFIDGVVQVIWKHDVAIIGIVSSRAWVYHGHIMAVNVTISNKGDFNETVEVTLYCNMSADEAIGVQTLNLSIGENKTLVFAWDTGTVAYCHSYTLTAVAEITDDSTLADNVLESPTTVKVRIMGDINGDDYVGIDDIFEAAQYFGQTPDQLRWNPDADLNLDEYVGIDDIYMVAGNFGQPH